MEIENDWLGLSIPYAFSRRLHFWSEKKYHPCTMALTAYDKKFGFLKKKWIFEKKIDKSKIWKKSWVFDKNGFLKKNFVFDKNLDFWQKFGFLTKIWIFDKNLDFWRKFGFLTEIWILTVISIFDTIWLFNQKLYWCKKNVDFRQKLGFTTNIWSFDKKDDPMIEMATGNTVS